MEAFAAGLRRMQDIYRLSLLGGDTTRHQGTDGPLTVAISAFGVAPSKGVMRRSGARPGDDIFASGTIGDGWLGLEAANGEGIFSRDDRRALTERYRRPTPRVGLGGALAGMASACIDVSDGLIADAGHLAAQSGVGLELLGDRLPVSPAAARWLERAEDKDAALGALAAGGDDYELLFAASPSLRRSIEMASKVTRTPVTKIGVATRGAGVRLLSAAGADITPLKGGYNHFHDNSKDPAGKERAR